MSTAKHAGFQEALCATYTLNLSLETARVVSEIIYDCNRNIV